MGDLRQIKNLLVQLLFLGTTSNVMAAPFIRFWRGYAKEGMPLATFKDGINQVFLPATGALFQTTAGLKSYQPILTKRSVVERQRSCADEFALVEYASPESYATFRATPEGQAYGNLHWDYFNRDTSKSVVAEPYVDNVVLEKAYYILNGEVDWNASYTVFTVAVKAQDVSAEAYMDALRDQIEAMKRSATDFGLRGYAILVTPDYIASFEAWPSKESSLEYDEFVNGDFSLFFGVFADIEMSVVTPLRRGEINFGEGLKWTP